MNNFERVKNLVNKYVQEHGTNEEMTRGDFLAWVHETYENISAEKNNLYPTDISYNLYNAGLKDFPGQNLCLIYVEERGTFRLVGTDYKYTGPIYQYKRKSNEKVVGQWINGVCKMGEVLNEEMKLPENVLLRRSDLATGIKFSLRKMPVSVNEKGRNVIVEVQGLIISGVSVEDEGYKIFNASYEWANNTTYLCEKAEDGSWFYYLETIDECIGEIQRIVMFESQRGKITSNSSEL